jgi:hypothetical protein
MGRPFCRRARDRRAARIRAMQGSAWEQIHRETPSTTASDAYEYDPTRPHRTHVRFVPVPVVIDLALEPLSGGIAHSVCRETVGRYPAQAIRGRGTGAGMSSKSEWPSSPSAGGRGRRADRGAAAQGADADDHRP